MISYQNYFTKRWFNCLTAVLIFSLSACVTPPDIVKHDYTAFRDANPSSILIVPAINKSVEVDAPDYYLSTAAKPLAERGYYVFPVNLVKRVMEDDGLADGGRIRVDVER